MARVGGNQGSITMSGNTAMTNAFTVAEMFAWAGQFGVYPDNTTPLGYASDRIEGFGQYGFGTLSYLVQDGQRPPIPNGAQVTLTLLEKSGQSYSFSAVLTFVDLYPVTAVRPGAQRVRYRWVLSAASSSVALSTP